ncbi:MAG: hypothetical protein ACXQTV_02420 [Candidatus Hecatellaceae archaeon]
MSVRQPSQPLECVVLDKGYADLALLKPGDSKLHARIFNLKTGLEKRFKVDLALFGYLNLIELSPKTLESPITLKISLYLVEKIKGVNLTFLEMIL